MDLLGPPYRRWMQSGQNIARQADASGFPAECLQEELPRLGDDFQSTDDPPRGFVPALGYERDLRFS